MRDSEIAVNDPVDMSRVQRLPERGVRDSRAAARRVHQPRSTQGSPRQVSFFFDACCSCLSLLNSSRSGMGNGGIQETTIKMCVCVCVQVFMRILYKMVALLSSAGLSTACFGNNSAHYTAGLVGPHSQK